MKTLSQIVSISIVYLSFNFQSASGNWQKPDKDSNTPYTQNTPYTKETQHSNSDSLPSGVTKDWMESLTDERGKRIIQEEDPQTDALQQKTFNGVAANDYYGRSVSSAGDVNGDGFDDVIVGAPRNGGGLNPGKAYIYFGDSIMNTSADVILTGAAANYYFGTSVSGAGDVNSDGYDDVIVGAPGYNTFTGRAYIYHGGAAMNSTADVTMTGEASQSDFGYSVSGAGDVNGDGFSDVIIGAYRINGNTGKAYIYYGGSSMNNIADVTMSGETFAGNFGSSVSGAGDVNADGYQDVICGAFGYNSYIGKAYIYFGGVSMDNAADVEMYGSAIYNSFGGSVSNAGDVNDDGYSDVIVGAYGYNSDTGRVYVFYGGSSMNNSADVIMTGEAAYNSFGYSVSEAGDVNGDGFADVYVGAWGYSASRGRAYLYYGGTSMNNVVDIYVTGDTTQNYFGYSVAGGGDVNGDGFSDMIVGAYGYNSNTGRAYVYTNTMTGEDIPDLIMTGESPGDIFGNSVSGVGDVNNDGYEDVIVGSPWANGTTEGKAYIFYGGKIINNVADVTLQGYDFLGYSASCAGDVNGDGFSDVIVGSRYNIGKVYIYYGGVIMNNIADVILTGNPGINFYQVSDAGDVNSDGYDDVIISDNTYDSSRGISSIYHGGSAMDNIADMTLTGGYTNEGFGSSVSGAGDVNGDGYDDVVIGAPYSNGSKGRAYIYYGNLIMNNVADVTLSGENSIFYFGESVSGAGDVNGDGYDDVIVGVNIIGGRAYIFYGSPAMNNVADVIFSGNDSFGFPASGGGDVNGDGFDDVIVGEYGYSGQTGRAFIFFGSPAMNNVADVIMIGEYSNSFFGSAVSDAGDMNGDGISDLIVGASENFPQNGRAYIYLSSPPDKRKNLFLFGAIQGMYDPVLNTEVPDTIKVYLRNSTSPFARVDSSKNILLGPLTGQQFLFRNVQNGRPYYIEVTHRNALTTWSANPVTFVNSDASIAYSVSSIYAYGNNEIQVDNAPYNVFAFYSGDVNQDGAIDLADVLQIYNDANSFLSGYVVTDLTGNNIVDLADVLIAYNNSVGFVSVKKP